MTPKLKLIIDKTEEGYVASIEEISGHTLPVKLEQKTSISIKDRKSLIESFSLIGQIYGIVRGEVTPTDSGEVLWSNLTTSGHRLYTKVLPKEVRDTLGEYDRANIIIDTNDVEIPFELFHDGKDFFCMKYNVGRQVRTQKKVKRPKISEREEIKAAIICNPTEDLEGALKEGEEIFKTFSSMIAVTKVDLFLGTKVTKALFRGILSSDYDIIHYAGHVDYVEENPESSGFRLMGEHLTGREVRDTLKGNPLVFVNACTSARSSLGMEGMAASFIYGGEKEHGVVGYIGSAWPVHDDAASLFAKTFYIKLCSGNPVGDSLKMARMEVLKEFGKKEAAWASFILYGDPARKLVTKSLRTVVIQTGLMHLPLIRYTSALFSALGISFILGGIAATIFGADYSMGSMVANIGGLGIFLILIALPIFLVYKLLSHQFKEGR